MPIRFTHTDFEVDITNLKPQFTEENQWFSDGFFAKFSFPFDMPIDLVENNYFDYLRNYNDAEAVTYFKGLLALDDVLEDAIFEVEEINGEILRVNISYGLENFPNWDTPLKELPLFQNSVANIRTHAQSIIGLTYPSVLYNFPMVHTKEYAETDGIFRYFQGTYNKRVDGSFILNEADFYSNVVYNRNIMKPLPYLMHVLKVGVESAGYALQGDVVNDVEYTKTLLGTPNILNIPDLPGKIDFITTVADRAWEGGGVDPEAVWISNLEIDVPGRWLVRGAFKNFDDYAKIFTFNGVQIYALNGYDSNSWINFEFEIITLPDITNVLNFWMKDNNTDDDVMISTVTPLELYDENGDVINYIADSNEINLAHHVPEVTFGELVKALKNQKNLSFIPKPGNIIEMNYVEDQMVHEDALDLSEYEVKRPQRKRKQGISYLLQYTDTNDDEVSYTKIFINREGSVTEDFDIDEEKTTQITSNLWPLPNKVKDEINTAYLFSSDKTKINLILYDGLVSGKNISQSNAPFLWPALYPKHWQRWIDFRIFSVDFRWVFKAFVAHMQGLDVYKKVFAYNNYHIVKKLIRSRIKPHEEEIEIETETLK